MKAWRVEEVSILFLRWVKLARSRPECSFIREQIWITEWKGLDQRGLLTSAQKQTVSTNRCFYPDKSTLLYTVCGHRKIRYCWYRAQTLGVVGVLWRKRNNCNLTAKAAFGCYLLCSSTRKAQIIPDELGGLLNTVFMKTVRIPLACA